MNLIQRIINELRKAVQGKDQVLIWILMTILADGNILLEAPPTSPATPSTRRKPAR